MKATKWYFPLVLFIMLYKVVLTSVCGVCWWNPRRNRVTIYMKSSLSIPKCASVHYSLLLMLVVLWWWWHCFHILQTLFAFVHFVSGLKTSSSDNEDCGRLDQNQSGKLLNEHFNYSYWLSVFLVNTDIILVVAAIKITTYFVFFRHSWQFSGCPYWERSQRCL